MSSDAVLQVSDLHVEFARGGGWVTAVDSLDLSVKNGEVLGIVGESGSGKSVTALSILGLLPENGRASGCVSLEGKRLLFGQESSTRGYLGKRIGMVFQEPLSTFNPTFKVVEQIAEPARLHLGMSRRAATHLAIEWLGRVGIHDAATRVNQYPHEFSGGMLQRAAIAMALVCEPALVIADEPTTALDVTTQAQILALLVELQAQYGLGLVFISHDLAVVADIADDVAVMYAGQIVEKAPAKSLFRAPQHPYTEGLIQSTPSFRTDSHSLSYIPGRVPDVGSWPVGCRFHPRCSYSEEHRCDAEPIPMLSVANRGTRCVRHAEVSLEGVTTRGLS